MLKFSEHQLSKTYLGEYRNFHFPVFILSKLQAQCKRYKKFSRTTLSSLSYKPFIGLKKGHNHIKKQSPGVVLLKKVYWKSCFTERFLVDILHKKWSFPLRISSVSGPKSGENFGFATFSENILTEKRHFLCSDNYFRRRGNDR